VRAIIVVPLEQAMRDPNFVQRGLLDHKIESASGKTIPALPMPVAPEFREQPFAKKGTKVYPDMVVRHVLGMTVEG